jgi:hypothetical protein
VACVGLLRQKKIVVSCNAMLCNKYIGITFVVTWSSASILADFRLYSVKCLRTSGGPVEKGNKHWGCVK